MLRDMSDERVASDLAAAGWMLRAMSTDNAPSFAAAKVRTRLAGV